MRLNNVAIASLIISASAISGCSVHRVNVQQGNALKSETVQKVQLGMTRNQVKFLLGTPLATNAFSQERWDYVFLFRKGYGPLIKGLVTVYFDGDKVSHIERNDQTLPAPSDIPVVTEGLENYS